MTADILIVIGWPLFLFWQFRQAAKRYPYIPPQLPPGLEIIQRAKK